MSKRTHPLVKQLMVAGVDVDNDVIGIWSDRWQKNWYISLGDWVSEDVTKSIRSMLNNVVIEAESTPDKKKYPVVIKEAKYTSIVLTLIPSEESVRVLRDKLRIAYPDSFTEVDPEEYHLTLKYLGKVTKDTDIDQLLYILLDCHREILVQKCVVGGVGRFFTRENDGTNAIYLSIDGKELNTANALVNMWSGNRGIHYNSGYGFIPHLTIGYIDEDEPTPDIRLDPFPVVFDTIALCLGDDQIRLPLKEKHQYEVDQYASKAVWSTSFINDLPDSSFLYIEPGGKKDSTGRTVPRSKRHFPYKDKSGKIDLPHLRNAIARIPQSNAPGLNKTALQNRARNLLSGTAKKSFKSSDKAKLTVFKQADGRRRWVIFSSNPYRDSDGEYVTQAAHENDIRMLDEDGYSGQKLRLWHMGEPYFETPNDWTTVKAGPGADIGECDFAAMHGRIRVESGTFYREEDGQAIADHADDLEASLAFSHPDNEPDERGGFLNIKSFERSLTPRGAASNLFTGLTVTKEKPMDPKKLKAFKDLGVDIEEVLKRAEGVQKKADKTAPYRLKSADVETEEEVEEMDIATKLDQLTAQMSALQQTMKGDDGTPEPEEKLEDLLLSELTVGELQDIVTSAVTAKSSQPIGLALKAIMEEMQEIKSILTSKSVQSVVEEVARMKAKLERQTARTKALGSKMREIIEEQPAQVVRRGTRPSESLSTLLDDDDSALTEKSSANPFSWIDDFIQKDGGGNGQLPN